jgi:hypothetical protein
MSISRSASFRLAAIFGVIAVGIVASPVRGEVADAVGGALGIHGAQLVPVNPHNPANALVAAAVPTLTKAQETTALRLASQDADVGQLFHGVKYEVAHVGPWTNAGASPRFIGVVLFVNLARPTDITGTWPTAVYERPERESLPYTEKRRHFTARGVRSVLVEVDLTRGVVAGVVPQGGS